MRGGRVFATFSGLAGAATPLGMVIAGWLLEANGIRTGLTILASVATIVTIGLWFTRPLREMNVADDEAGAVALAEQAALRRAKARLDSESG